MSLYHPSAAALVGRETPEAGIRAETQHVPFPGSIRRAEGKAGGVTIDGQLPCGLHDYFKEGKGT